MTSEVIIGYWDAQKRFFSAQKGRLEYLLRSFGTVTFRNVASLEDEGLKTCHILLTTADHVDQKDFLKWFLNFEKRVHLNQLIWIPAIILADLPIEKQKELLVHSLKINWYFDIVAGDQLDSLPLRMANMIRIHDHLRELYRYDQDIRQLQALATRLQQQLENLATTKGSP